MYRQIQLSLSYFSVSTGTSELQIILCFCRRWVDMLLI